MSKKKAKDAAVNADTDTAVDATEVVASTASDKEAQKSATPTLGTNRALTMALIAVAVVASMVIGGLLTFIFVTAGSDGQETYAYAEEYLSEEERQLNELEDLLQQLLAGSDPAELPFITGAEAREIALRYVGHGSVESDLLFLDDGFPAYEVDIRHDGTRYAVYVSAEGSVIDSNSFADISEEE